MMRGCAVRRVSHFQSSRALIDVGLQSGRTKRGAARLGSERCAAWSKSELSSRREHVQEVHAKRSRISNCKKKSDPAAPGSATPKALTARESGCALELIGTCVHLVLGRTSMLMCRSAHTCSVRS